MKNKPILIVAGEPNSIFFEIFFKSIKRKNYKNPLILICCKKNLKSQMKKFNFKRNLRLLKIFDIKKIKLDNKKINIININLLKSKNNKINIELSKKYITKSFDIAFKLIQEDYSYKLINGPINKNKFLNKKFLGVTENILANKFKEKTICNVNL